MARLFPSDYGTATRTAGEAAELETLEALRAGLSDDYTIFHGVHWADEHDRGTAVGELDFAVVNQAGAILIVEQKAGTLTETADGLVKDYGERASSVADQVHRAINHVQNKYASTYPGEKPRIDYLVYLPHHRLENVAAAGIGEDRIVHAASADNLIARIEKTLGRGKPDAERAERARAFFRQELNLVPSVDHALAAHERAYTRLAEGLACVADRLEMHPWRLRVIARAGSGKTQLALRVLDNADPGHGLYVCFNRPLAETLESLAPAGTDVHTFHGLCRHILESAGEPFEAAERANEPGFWDEVVERTEQCLVDRAPHYRTLVIDEGQDFHPDWYELLCLCAADNADILWLEDPLQELFNRRTNERNPDEIRRYPDENRRSPDGAREARGIRGDPETHQAIRETDHFITWRTHENHRNARHITRYIEKTLGIHMDARNDLPGDPVEHIAYNEPEEQLERVGAHIEKLNGRGYGPEQIAILTVHGHGNSPFAEVETVGGHRLRRLAGYTDDGHQRMTAGALTFDSVRRYKGQQAPAVILTDVDYPDWREDLAQKILYTGMTRAGMHLCIVHPETAR